MSSKYIPQSGKNTIRDRHSRMEVTEDPVGETRAQQQFKDEADINTIVKRYMKTGNLGNPNATRQPSFGDFSSVDYMEMRNAIADIDQDFASLSAKIRRRFNEDPYQLVRWLENPANAKEAAKLGLISQAEAGIDPQQDLVQEAKKAEQAAPKADPEAQPQHGKHPST